VIYWEDKELKTRYYKGTNKLFNVSKRQGFDFLKATGWPSRLVIASVARMEGQRNPRWWWGSIPALRRALCGLQPITILSSRAALPLRELEELKELHSAIFGFNAEALRRF